MKVNHETRFVGIDLGKRSYVIRLIDEKGKITGWTGKTNPESRKELYSRLKATDTIAIEAGNMAFIMTEEFEKLTGNKIYNLCTRKLFDIYLTDKKTDKEDALKLAKFIKNHDEEDMPIVLPPTEDQKRQRKIISEYSSLQKERVNKINRLHAVFEHCGLTDVKKNDLKYTKRRSGKIKLLTGYERTEADRLVEVIELLEKQSDELKVLMEKEVEKSKPAQIAKSVYGVGTVVGLSYVAVVGPVERYQNAAHVGSYLGFTPKVDCSSTIIKYGHISKHGNGYLRSLLVQSVWVIIRSKESNALKDKYEYMVRNGKSKKKAVVAIARKLGELIYTLIKNNDTYEPRRFTPPDSQISGLALEALKASEVA